jgi:hypothetical protein
MSTPSAESSFISSDLVCERLMAQTRYGKCADCVESMMIRYILAQCPKPGVLLEVRCEGETQVQGFFGPGMGSHRDR